MNFYKLSEIIERYAKWQMQKAGLKHHILDDEDYTFSYWDSESNNKPIYLLFHGYGTSTHLQFFGQVNMLAKTHRVILPNLLHFGSHLKGKNKYKIEDQVEAMSILIKALKIDTFILGGYSYGGLVAAELAVKEQSKIRMLTIFSSPLKFFNQEDIKSIRTKGHTKSVAGLLVPETLETATKFIGLLQFKERYIPKYILEKFYENLFQDEENNANYKALLNELLSKMKDLNTHNYDFDYPVLLIWGENDELIPNRIGVELNDYFKLSELHIIQKAGHLVTIEQCKKFNKILQEFLVKDI